MSFASITVMPIQDLREKLLGGEISGRTIVIASTHYPDKAGWLRMEFAKRGMERTLVLEYYDVEDPENKGAFSIPMAAEVRDLVGPALSAEEGFEVVCSCDGGKSRSAGIAAALMRFAGEPAAHSEASLWAWKSPNLLVYGRVLQATGAEPTERELESRRRIKRAASLAGSAKKGIHIMHLNDCAFRAVAEGSKTVEVRLLDEKRGRISSGNLLLFSETGNPAKLIAAWAEDLIVRNSFDELFSDPSIVTASGFESKRQAVEGMGRIYGPDPSSAALAIHLRLV